WQCGRHCAVQGHRRHTSGYTFFKCNDDTHPVPLWILIHLFQTRRGFQKTAIKIIFFQAQQVSLERWGVIRFPMFPRWEQRTLFRRHKLAERAATEVRVAREGDAGHRWKGLGSLRLRDCRVVRGTSSAQEEQQYDQYDTTSTQRAPTRDVGNGKPWRVHSAVCVP